MTILKRDDQGPVARLTLNRPEALNALSDELLAALRDEFSRLASDRAIRVVTLAGAGKVFCAGHDLKEMQAGRQSPDAGAAYFDDLFGRCAALMQMIPALPQPVIAAPHGIATAAGCQLVASCDLAIASDECRFGVNGVNIGLFCSTPMVALSRNMGRKKTFELLTTGQFLTAQEAEAHGLINRSVPADTQESAVMELAETIAAKLGSAVSVGKRAYYEQLDMGLAAAYDHTREVMVRNMLNADTDEGISAFIEKRKPNWTQ